MSLKHRSIPDDTETFTTGFLDRAPTRPKLKPNEPPWVLARIDPEVNVDKRLDNKTIWVENTLPIDGESDIKGKGEEKIHVSFTPYMDGKLRCALGANTLERLNLYAFHDEVDRGGSWDDWLARGGEGEPYDVEQMLYEKRRTKHELLKKAKE